jgi:hypothetical protein
MKWLLRGAGFYWPSTMADCFCYYKGSEECQKFGFSYHQTMAFSWLEVRLHWPNTSPSSKGHQFVLVAMDYFTKWTEIVPLKNMTHKEVIEFITEHIFHRFSIPQTLTIDQGTLFMSKKVREFAELYKIKLLNSSPYYAQACPS